MKRGHAVADAGSIQVTAALAEGYRQGQFDNTSGRFWVLALVIEAAFVPGLIFHAPWASWLQRVLR